MSRMDRRDLDALAAAVAAVAATLGISEARLLRWRRGVDLPRGLTPPPLHRHGSSTVFYTTTGELSAWLARHRDRDLDAVAAPF